MTGYRQTLDAARRSRIRDLTQRQGHSAEIQMDLKKAFEQVHRGKLLDLAIAEGCPLEPLLLFLGADRWPRRLVYELGAPAEAELARLSNQAAHCLRTTTGPAPCPHHSTLGGHADAAPQVGPGGVVSPLY
jgi:hypothetical protein